MLSGLILHGVGTDGCGWLQSAIDADPKNPLAKFEKAAVLMSQEQYQPALNELEALKVCCCSHFSASSTQWAAHRATCCMMAAF